MFNHNHYVPILRWKAAEKEALKNLEPKDKNLITPLIELLMPQPKDDGPRKKSASELLEESISLFKTSLPKIPEEVSKYWGPEPVFMDLHLIDGSIRAAALSKLLSLGANMNICTIPVINIAMGTESGSDSLTRKVAIEFAQKNIKCGVCIRLSRSQLYENSLLKEISNTLKRNNLHENNVDLFVDLQIVDDKDQTLIGLINSIALLAEWRTFTLASGAFPPDLTQFTKPDRYDIPRTDWINWLDINNHLTRKSSFADYTIQHPIYTHPVSRVNPSASIRYTLDDAWLIMKGQGLRGKKSKGHSQYPGQANLLMNQKEFFGDTFSYGDSYIARIGKDVNNKETGNPRTWLRAGINHHLVCVVSQISSLS